MQIVGAIEAATLALMDLPPLRDADDDLGFYYAMAGATDAWRGGALYRSVDGVTYAQVANSDAPTPMGCAVTALPSGPTTVHDDANTVTVRLTYGALESVTRAQSLNGANAALLGDEILTFDKATPLGGADWQLSGLLRGRKGSEWVVGSHIVGERFVLLDAGSIGRALDTAAWRNAPLHYKGVSAGLAVATATDTLFTDTGASLKPYSPVHIAALRDGSDNLTITWIRRARLYAGRGLIFRRFDRPEHPRWHRQHLCDQVCRPAKSIVHCVFRRPAGLRRARRRTPGLATSGRTPGCSRAACRR